jgi:magnesium chelatase accessory protein
MLNWDREGLNWPNRAASRFVPAGGLRWRVEEMGSGPVALLLHGTGASTHSWRHFGPILAERFRVIALDLPGHGFTECPRASHLTLSHMAQSIGALLNILHVKPDIAIGHSAGAAILCRMALDHRLDAKAIVSLNGAFFPYGGVASQFFGGIARLLFLNPFIPRFFSWHAYDNATVRRLINGTGSQIDAEGLALYAQLFRNPAHVGAALGMMANWDLESLSRELPRLKPKLTLITGSNDKAVPPDVAFRVQDIVPGSKVILLRGLGHLAHEEKPAEVAGHIFSEATRYSILSREAAQEPAE